MAQEAAHDTKSVHVPRSAARGQRLRWIYFLQPDPAGPIWTSRHVKCGLFAQWWRPKHAGFVPPYSPATNSAFLTSQFLDAPVLCPLAPFMQHLSWRRSLGQAETIELSDSRGRCFQGMLRHCHSSCMQKMFSLQKSGPAGVVGQTQHIQHIRVQPAPGNPWRENERHSCAVVLCKACTSKRF